MNYAQVKKEHQKYKTKYNEIKTDLISSGNYINNNFRVTSIFNIKPYIKYIKLNRTKKKQENLELILEEFRKQNLYNEIELTEIEDLTEYAEEDIFSMIILSNDLKRFDTQLKELSFNLHIINPYIKDLAISYNNKTYNIQEEITQLLKVQIRQSELIIAKDIVSLLKLFSIQEELFTILNYINDISLKIINLKLTEEQLTKMRAFSDEKLLISILNFNKQLVTILEESKKLESFVKESDLNFENIKNESEILLTKKKYFTK